MFVSRAALSISMMFFLGLTLHNKNFLKQLRSYSNNIFPVGISLLFFIPFVSGLWSNNVEEWARIIQVKLPLLLFPIAFAGSWRLSENQYKSLAIFF